MLRTLVYLLLISLIVTVASWQTSSALTVSEEPESEFISGQTSRPTTKKSTPTPTPSPTPSPKRTVEPKKYPAPVLDEDRPAESPRAKAKWRRPKASRKPSPTPTPTPTATPSGTPLKKTGVPKRYVAPLLDEDKPAESPELVSLTGTFRLNADEIGRVSQGEHDEQNAEQLKLFWGNLQPSVAAPRAVAIDFRGKTVNIISTRAQRITFEADGLEHLEPLPGGDSLRTTATMEGANLVIRSSGSGRAFKVSFEPITENRLLITRQFSSDKLSQPIVVQNVYDRISNVAQWDAVQLDDRIAESVAPRNSEFIVPNGESLVVTLNNELTTKQAKTGDHFTMTVRSPAHFEGAIIEGRVTNIRRDSEVGRSSLTLHFDTVRLPDGKSYKFDGVVESVGNESKVAASRTAIGASVGAIIAGAVSGGASIGAAIGSGTSAGSVLRGTSEVELPSGSELRIRAFSNKKVP